MRLAFANFKIEFRYARSVAHRASFGLFSIKPVNFSTGGRGLAETNSHEITENDNLFSPNNAAM